MGANFCAPVAYLFVPTGPRDEVIREINESYNVINMSFSAGYP
jgi:hypothetical protein